MKLIAYFPSADVFSWGVVLLSGKYGKYGKAMILTFFHSFMHLLWK
jgi:hypothetical protein